MKTLLIVLALVLAGCSEMTQPEDIPVAEEVCSKRGGYTHVSRAYRGKKLMINCKDGTLVDMNPGGRR